MFNFFALTFNAADRAFDLAPNQGAFNYSLDANGPQIISVDVKKTPAAGPRAGRRFVIVPTGLKLPPDGQVTPPVILPQSYSCSAKLGAKKLASGAGVCSMAIPKKNAKGKRLTVLLTVKYQVAPAESRAAHVQGRDLGAASWAQQALSSLQFSPQFLRISVRWG
jgi:hypothetical protein